MSIQTIQKLIWNIIQVLRQSGMMTNREAANLCLVCFTWTPEQAKAKLTELKERYTNRK